MTVSYYNKTVRCSYPYELLNGELTSCVSCSTDCDEPNTATDELASILNIMKAKNTVVMHKLTDKGIDILNIYNYQPILLIFYLYINKLL